MKSVSAVGMLKGHASGKGERAMVSDHQAKSGFKAPPEGQKCEGQLHLPRGQGPQHKRLFS